MNYIDIAKEQLKVDEGFRTHPYRDTVGKLTIGVGRNLDDVGLRGDEVELMLGNDVADADAIAKQLFDNFGDLTEPRKAVLVNMAFNLGLKKLAAFAMLRSAISSGQWEQAADDMLESMWSKQVGQRAIRLAEQMRRG